MSSDHTVSDVHYSSTSSDESDGVVDNRPRDVDQLVTVEDPTKVVMINRKGMLEQSAVRAMALVVEFPDYIDVEEASTSGRPLGILKNDSNPTSLVTEENLRNLRMIYGIPDDVELRAPKEHERVDWDIPGWTCFYEYTLRLGFRFSVPCLVRHML